MEVNVNTKAICTIDIDSVEAFRILCETLHMGLFLTRILITLYIKIPMMN